MFLWMIKANWKTLLFIKKWIVLTLFGMGMGKKTTPNSFFPVTSTNEGVSPENFLTFSYNAFVTLV